MPVRKVSNRGANTIGYFPSLKMRRMVAFESLIERDYLYLLDYDPHVRVFEEQPLVIAYQHEGQLRHYTPDFHVVGPGWNQLVECKPAAFIERDENQRCFHAASGWCAEQGWEFRVVTDRDLRTGFRLPNVKLLTRYARHVVDPRVQGQVYRLLRTAQEPITVEDIANELPCADRPTARASVLSLAFHQQVLIPLDDAPITDTTLVYRPAGQEGG